jgi:hypothetical protein
MTQKIAARIINKPWQHVIVAAVCLAVAYALASWGIDSGRLTAYFGAIVFGIVAISQLVRAVKGYAK